MPRLLDALALQLPQAKRTTLRRMLHAGRVRVNGHQVIIASRDVGPDDRVTIDLVNPAPRQVVAGRATQAPVRVRGRGHLSRASIEPTLPIIYEDRELVVVNKPCGLLTSTVPREKRPTLAAMLRQRYAGRPGVRMGVIHRLDRDASGLLVFSLNPKCYAELKCQLAEHRVTRRYLAVVDGQPPESGIIRSKLAERTDGIVRVTLAASGQIAVTRYRRVRSAGGQSLLDVELETGRKHQIRVHLSSLGFPITGDQVYGGSAAPRLMLVAAELGLLHPGTRQRMTFTLPTDDAFYQALPAGLGGNG